MEYIGIYKNEIFPLIKADIKEKTGLCILECYTFPVWCSFERIILKETQLEFNF